MKDLLEFNKELQEQYIKENTYPKYIGIACPECGNELQDESATVLMSWPAQKRVICPSCGYQGLRVS